VKRIQQLVSLGLLALLAACNQTATTETPKPPLSVELSVSPKTESFMAGDAAKQFSATLKNATGNVSWSIAPSGVGTLSATTGAAVRYTPPSSVAAVTTLTLTAISNGVSNSATITVNPVPVPALTISPKTRTIVAGSAATEFSATLTNSSAVINWSISPSGVGSLSSSSGATVEYTPPATLTSVTEVTLTASADGVSDSATITVNPAPSLSVNPETRSLVAGSAATEFSATLANSSGTINWSISPEIGNLSATTGTSVSYTPPASVATTTTVTLTATSGSLSASATITVTPFVNVAGEGRNLTLQNWPAGSSGTLNITSMVSGSFTQTPVAIAPISTAGQFSYNLPAATVLGPIDGTFPATCGLTVNNPAPGARVANGVVMATEGSNSPRSVRIANNPTRPSGAPLVGYAEAVLMYSNAAWSVTGTCVLGGSTTNYNLNPVQGWNWFIVTTDAASSQTFSSSTTLPAGFNWYY
jgi:nitrogen fixation protein FixH